jgi:hypothetical protein
LIWPLICLGGHARALTFICDATAEVAETLLAKRIVIAVPEEHEHDSFVALIDADTGRVRGPVGWPASDPARSGLGFIEIDDARYEFVVTRRGNQASAWYGFTLVRGYPVVARIDAWDSEPRIYAYGVLRLPEAVFIGTCR